MSEEIELQKVTKQPQNHQQQIEGDKFINLNNFQQNSVKSNDDRKSSIGKYKTLSRKPDNKYSNIQSYKHIKRKSMEKNEKFSHQLIRYDSNNQEKQDKISNYDSEKQLNYKQSIVSSTYMIKSKRRGQEMVEEKKFKKKALTKEQIIQVKRYVQGLTDNQSEKSSSIAATERLSEEFKNIEMKFNALNQKKSKTEYFHIEDFQMNAKNGHPDLDQVINYLFQSQLSESDKVYVNSLKEKCLSVGENNLLLQKRLKWLKEEIEMHLQRQGLFQIQKQMIIRAMRQQQIEKIEQARRQQRIKGQKELQQQKEQIKNLKQKITQIENQYKSRIQIYQIDLAKLIEEKKNQIQNCNREWQEKLKQKQAEEEKSRLTIQNQWLTQNINTDSQKLIQKLYEEIKYLKIKNYTLVRIKQDYNNLRREHKKVAQERDSFKKKIIQKLKKQSKQKFNQEEDQDQGDSDFFQLSEISISNSQIL